jgi:hypothetical protein
VAFTTTMRSSPGVAGVKTLVPTHLLAQIDQPGIREQIVHEIQQVFDGKVVWGEDLMRLGLSGSRVSTIDQVNGNDSCQCVRP